MSAGWGGTSSSWEARSGGYGGDDGLLAIVLHGGPGLSDYTEALADELVDAGDGRLRAARYQQRGLEPSTTAGPFTLDQHVADAVEVIDHFGSDAALLVGHSWGAHLAMHVAVAFPTRIAGLLLIDPLGGVGDGGESTMTPTIMNRIGDRGRAALAALEQSGIAPETQPLEQFRIIWPGYFAEPENAPPMPPLRFSGVGAQLMPEVMELMRDGVVERALPSVSVPTSYVIARHSPIDPEVNAATAALFPNAEVHLLDTGHFPWIEQPGILVAPTRALLRRVAEPH